MSARILFTRYILLIFLHHCAALLSAQNAMKGNDIICGINSDNSKEICRQVRENILRLKEAGKIVFAAKDKQDINSRLQSTLAAASPIRFKWPLRSRNPEEYAYLGGKNFVDLDTTYSVNGNGDTIRNMKDYNGGDHTYNGHNGMDIMVGPYWWERQKNNEVYAIAAAPGIIVDKRDGGFDGNCSWSNPPWVGVSGSGNFVAILHADDSTVSYYKHLKNGSVTDKEEGEYVDTGEILGVIASSGRSTGPHLHFEIHVGWSDPVNPDGRLVEPFYGPYNYTTGASLWDDQKPYIEPAIMGMETHRANNSTDYPNFYGSSCDSTVDLSSLWNFFGPGSWFVAKTFFRDWVDGSTISCYIEDPNGTLHDVWPVSNDSLYRFAYHRRMVQVPQNPVHGTWKYNVAFNGKTYTHYFIVGSCVTNLNTSATHTGNRGYIVSNSIVSTATISGSSSNNVQYKADNFVQLNPGFTATAGCTFLANTKGCANGIQ